MTKVEAVKTLLKKEGSEASWETIYRKISKFYPGAKDGQFWQEGIRGIVYREIRYNRNFKMASKGVVALR